MIDPNDLIKPVPTPAEFIAANPDFEKVVAPAQEYVATTAPQAGWFDGWFDSISDIDIGDLIEPACDFLGGIVDVLSNIDFGS